MQDRYLFRGKRLDNGAWETGTLVIERMYTSEEKHFITDKMTGHHTPVDPATVGQCTGLKDKNGRLIFEGDIVVSNGYERVVVWGSISDENVLIDGAVENEVIGNIHDMA